MPRRVDSLEEKFPFAILKISMCPDTRMYFVNSHAARLPGGGGTEMEILHGKILPVFDSTGSVPTPLPLVPEQHPDASLVQKDTESLIVIGISLLRYLKYINISELFRCSKILFNKVH